MNVYKSRFANFSFFHKGVVKHFAGGIYATDDADEIALLDRLEGDVTCVEKAEPKVEVKAEVKPEPKAEVKAEEKPAPKAKPKSSEK